MVWAALRTSGVSRLRRRARYRRRWKHGLRRWALRRGWLARGRCEAAGCNCATPRRRWARGGFQVLAHRGDFLLAHCRNCHNLYRRLSHMRNRCHQTGLARRLLHRQRNRSAAG